MINEVSILNLFKTFIRTKVTYDALEVTRLNKYIKIENARLDAENDGAGAGYNIAEIPDEEDRYVIAEIISNSSKSLNNVWVDMDVFSKETEISTNFNSVQSEFIFAMRILMKSNLEDVDFYKAVSYNNVMLNIFKEWVSVDYGVIDIRGERIFSPMLQEITENKTNVYVSGVVVSITEN